MICDVTKMPINTFLAALAFPRANVIDPFGLFHHPKSKFPHEKLQHSFSDTDLKTGIPRILWRTKPTDFPQRLTHGYNDVPIPTTPTTDPPFDSWSEKLLFHSSKPEAVETTNWTINHIITFTSSLPKDLTNVVYYPNELSQQIGSIVVVCLLIFVAVYHFYKIISPSEGGPSSSPSKRIQIALSLLTIASALIVIQTFCWKLATNGVVPKILCHIWNVPIALNLGILSFKHLWLFTLKLCSTRKLLLLELGVERLTEVFSWIYVALGITSVAFGIGYSTTDISESNSSSSIYCSVEQFQTMWSRYHSASVMILAAQCLFVNYLALKFWIQHLANRPTESKTKSPRQNANQSCLCRKPCRSQRHRSMQVCPICNILISSIEVPCEHLTPLEKPNVVFLSPQFSLEQEQTRGFRRGLVSLQCLGQLQQNRVHPTSESSLANEAQRVKRRKDLQSSELNGFIDDSDSTPVSCIQISSSCEDSLIRPCSTNLIPTDSRANSSSQMRGNMPDRLYPLIVPEPRVLEDEDVPTSKEMKSEMFDLIFEQKSDQDLFEAARSMRKLHRSLSLRRRFNFDVLGDSQDIDGDDLASTKSSIRKRSSSDPQINSRQRSQKHITKSVNRQSKDQIAEQDLIQRIPSSAGSSQTYKHMVKTAWRHLDPLLLKYSPNTSDCIIPNSLTNTGEKIIGINPWIHFFQHQLVYLPLLMYYIFLDDLKSGYQSILCLIMGLIVEPLTLIVMKGVLPRCRGPHQWFKKNYSQLFGNKVIVLD